MTIIYFNKIIAIFIILLFISVTAIRFFEDNKRLTEIASTSAYSEKMIKSNNMSSFLMFDDIFKKNFSLKNNLFKTPLFKGIVVDQIKSTEAIDNSTSSEDLFEYEEREISETDLLAIRESNSIETSSSLDNPSEYIDTDISKKKVLISKKLTFKKY